MSTSESSDATRASLIEQWLRHFGAEDARELDLGTLAAIKEFIEDGLVPSLSDHVADF